MKFYDFAHGTAAMRGQLKSYVDAGGREITASYGGNHLISSFVQSSGGDSNGYYYDYTSVGGADRLEYVTLKVDASNVRRVEYDYYDGSDSHGSAGDLRRARIQEWDGSAWNTKSTHYYRYYKSGDTDGVAHGVKYVLSPLGYASMVAAGITPETATNAQVEAYCQHLVPVQWRPVGEGGKGQCGRVDLRADLQHERFWQRGEQLEGQDD
ncbi:MAG: hypothetical protein KIS67_23385 [Verrucomicrobiae bacterium]|nr:hypothetical protein [Verrucomicrobiae bacterium]